MLYCVCKGCSKSRSPQFLSWGKKKKTVPECQVFRSCVIWFPLLSLSSARPHAPWTGWLWERAGLFHPLLCCHRLPLSLARLAHTHSLGFSDSSSEKFSLISQYSDGCPPYLFLSLSLFFFWPRGLQDLTSLTKDWTPGPQQWNCTELTTGPPGKSPSLHVSTASSLSCPAVPTLDGKCLLKRLPLWLSCELLRDPMDCSPPDSSVHGIFQARALEWGAIAFSNSLDVCKCYILICMYLTSQGKSLKSVRGIEKRAWNLKIRHIIKYDHVY